MQKPLALTLGEPAGIGPDIALAAWLQRDSEKLPPFYLRGDGAYLRARAAGLGLAVPIVETTAAEAAALFPTALPVMPAGPRVTARPGTPDENSAPAAIAAIDAALDDVRRGAAAALVTNPIAKHVLYAAGFPDPGHTEYLARRCAADGITPMPVMMLWSETLAVVPVTVHIALKEAIAQLSSDLIVKTARITAAALQRSFGLARPRLAIAGLNPHAGEHGTLGSEDAAIVAPAIAALRAEGIAAVGPLPPDTMFHAAARAHYDAAICMYHDQALIPIKTLAFDEAVNVTLGLPVIRTSPDHGTAFDIAGTGRANPASLIAALKLAARMAAQAPAAQ